jgi:hypothetical protein
MNTIKLESAAIAIRRIKDISFFVNDGLFINSVSKEFKVELQQQLTYNIETNFVAITLRVYYHFEGSEPNENLVDIQVENVYEILDLVRFIYDNELRLPPDVIVTLLQLSVSHTRALLAKNMAGTALQDQIMSIINPVDLATTFYPRMMPPIESENTETKQVAKLPKKSAHKKGSANRVLPKKQKKHSKA